MCKLCRDVIFEKGANLIVVEIKVQLVWKRIPKSIHKQSISMYNGTISDRGWCMVK